MPFHAGGIQAGLPQYGNGKHGIFRRFGTCRTWMALVRLQGIAFPAPHGWSRCRVSLQTRDVLAQSDPEEGVRTVMVRIRCESGVRIKIPESGFKNPDPDAFAFSLVWFADPDHVRIRNHLHFLFFLIFLRIRTQGSGSWFASHPTAL